MNSVSPPNREKAIFEQALDLGSGPERQAFVKGACGEDAALCARVLALLQANETDQAFLPAESQDQPTVLLPVTEKPGDKIGRYRLMEKIGEGGCGLVYVAEQEEPVRRRVALKVIKLGMDTREVVARFEAERQALALMDHPNIARVFDGGATDTGRPYFVLELVRGVRITEFCDQHQLPTVERLKLFVQVCHAIQHAHQKGIIHRDIKPSNILVSLHDDVPVPKVIDFGIAKAVGERLTDKTLYTRYEQFMGTPAYMSPEQAGRSDLGVDTRSDIYALGVLLYELLAGRPPFDPQQLAEVGLEEMVRCIREQEPLRPSTRLSRLHREELTTTAQQRGTEPPKLISLLRGDLDWIVMKCLEKNRARRYDTANGLAHDIESYLSHEPIMARPPSSAYRVGKFVRRNKVWVAAGSAVAAALVLGIVASTWQAVRASRLRARAEANEEKALAAEAKEVQQRQRADEARGQAQAQAYASDMKAAQVALQQDNRAMAIKLLRGYLPKAGEEDLRGVEWRYLWQESQSDELLSFSHPAMVDTALFTPDGRNLATRDHDGIIRVWDLASGKQVQEWQPRGSFFNAVKSLGCSADGMWLAAPGKSGVEIWDRTSGRVIRELESALPPLCFSPDGNFLATGATNGLWLWNLRNWTHRELANASADFNNLAFSPDGTWMVCGSMSNPLQLWNLRTGIVTVLAEAENPAALDISPDGKWLAYGNWKGRVSLWDLASQQQVQRFRAHPGVIFGLAFSPDSKRLATGGDNQLIHLWETGTSNKVGTLQGHLNEVWSLGFSRDGQKLVSSSKDGTAKLWSATGGQAKSRRFALPPDSIPQGPLPDGSAMVTVDSKQRLTQLWSLPGGALLRSIAWNQFEEKGCGTVWHMPDNQVVLGRDTNGTLHSWSLRTAAYLSSAPLGATNLEVLCLSLDERWLSGTSPDGGLALFDLRIPRTVRHFADYVGPSYRPRAVFSADGRWFAYCATNYAIKIWDLTANREKATLKGHIWYVSPLRFSQDGKLLASGGMDGNVWLWSVDAAKPLFSSLIGHRSGVTTLSFSTDGKTLVSDSQDQTTRWWSVATRKEMLLSESLRMVPYWGSLGPSVHWDLGGKILVWQEPQGPIRVTMLPTLAEIDAAESQRTKDAQPH